MAGLFAATKATMKTAMTGVWRGLLSAGLVLGLPVLAGSASAASVAAAADASTCDKECLNGLMKAYLAALVRHDPAGLPVATNVKASENAQIINLGAGGAWTQIKLQAIRPPTHRSARWYTAER
jgi:hypothetical protein